MTGDADGVVDVLVVGAGPTGIAVGAEAIRRGLAPLLVDRGPLCAHLLAFPTDMLFFTTRDLLEIADVPFAVPEDKPSRRQAIAYYQGVARRYRLPLALEEEVLAVLPEGEGFVVATRRRDGDRRRRARAVVFATGYFGNPRRLGVPGEDLPWVSSRYREPYPHFGQRVVVVGGGNSAAEAALDLWRNGAGVTVVHRRPQLKPTIKYWVKPDLENRIAEGSIAVRLEATVRRFVEGGVEVEGPDGVELLPADAAYLLIGYAPEVGLLGRAGIAVDPETLVPAHDAASGESDVPGLYVAGTLQAGRRTDLIFIENSRDHGRRIVDHLLAGRLRPRAV